MTNAKRYLIPDTIDPGSLACARVYIPNDPLYIGAFWNAYEFFAKWVAWEEDETKIRAKQAAAVWRDAFERARAEWDCSLGECGIVDVRQSESPCILEKQTECDGSWEQFADMRLCVPKMRTYQGRLQQWNGTEWVTVDPDTPPYDERIDGAITPAWETVPPGQDGACLSAANAVEYVYQRVQDIAIANRDFLEWLTWFSALVGGISLIVGVGVVIVLLAGAIVALVNTFGGDWQDVADYDFRDDLRCAMKDRYSEDGTMSSSSWDMLKNDIVNMKSGKTAAEIAALELARIIVDVMGPVGMSRLANFAGISSYDCDYCGCDSSMSWDFSTGNQLGWELKYPDIQGIWLGNGWGDDYPNKAYDAVSILSPSLPAMKTCKVIVTLNTAMLGSNPGAQFGNFDQSIYYRVYSAGPIIEVPLELTLAENDKIVVQVDGVYGALVHMDEILQKVELVYTSA